MDYALVKNVKMVITIVIQDVNNVQLIIVMNVQLMLVNHVLLDGLFGN